MTTPTTMTTTALAPCRLSSGRLVSERIIELLDSIELRGLVAAKIILGSRAKQLLWKEMKPILVTPIDDHDSKLPQKSFFHGVEIFESAIETAEYVGVDAHI